MRNSLMSIADRILLRKRALIETVNDELKNIAQIEHSRHRSFSNFIANSLSAIAVYCFFEKKPAIEVNFINDGLLSFAFMSNLRQDNVFSHLVAYPYVPAFQGCRQEYRNSDLSLPKRQFASIACFSPSGSLLFFRLYNLLFPERVWWLYLYGFVLPTESVFPFFRCSLFYCTVTFF